MPRGKHTVDTRDLLHEEKWLCSVRDCSAAAYIIQYNIRNRQAGHHQYLQLINRANISKEEKKQLVDAFESWKKSYGAAFWEARSGADGSSAAITTTTKAQGSPDHVSLGRSEDGKFFSTLYCMSFRHIECCSHSLQTLPTPGSTNFCAFFLSFCSCAF